jgi:hypothetical protein
MNKHFLFFFLILFFAKTATCQDKDYSDYSKFIKHSWIGKITKEKTNDSSSEITYLGDITDSNGKTVYYVIKEFSTVQAAIVMHGHSNIIFLDTDKKIVRMYYLGTPDELPKSLKNNKLIFEYTDEKTKQKVIHQESIGKELPKMICVKPDDCY